MAETTQAEDNGTTQTPPRAGGSNLLLIGGAAGLVVAVALVTVSIVIALNQRNQAPESIELPPDYVPEVGATLPADPDFIPALPPDIELPEDLSSAPPGYESEALPPLALNNLPPGVSPVQVLLSNPSLILGDRLKQIADWLSCVMSAAALVLSVLAFRRTRPSTPRGEVPPR